MPFIRVIPGVMEFAIHGLWTNGRQVTNVFHVKKLNEQAWTLTPGGGLDVVQDVLFRWQDQVMAGLLNNYQIVDMSFIDLTTISGVSGILAPNPALPLAGGNVSASGPPNVSLLVHKNTVSTRNQRSGRSYIMALSEADVDENGLVSAPLQAGIDARFLNYKTQVDQTTDGLQYELHVIHIQIPPGPPPAEDVVVFGTSTRLDSFTTDPVAATQRRRLRG